MIRFQFLGQELPHVVGVEKRRKGWKEGRKEKRERMKGRKREIKKLYVSMSVLTELNICVRERVVSKQMNI